MRNKADRCSGLEIVDIWPVNTKVCPNGGIGVSWVGDIGFGQFTLVWEDDGSLHADTECLDSDDDRLFTETILKLLAQRVVIDG